MNFKFLPIGTVCLVDDVAKKQLIIGYLKSGYDYVAVEYPKGFESDTKLSYFNHSQVKELYSLGYKNEESRIFNGILMGAQIEEDIEKIPMVEDILDDERTFVKKKLEPKRLPKKELTDMGDIQNAPVVLGLKFDRNGIGNFENKENTNGTLSVVSEIPFHRNDAVISDDGESEKRNTLRFSKSGIVVAEKTEKAKENPPTSIHKLKFNRDGMLISEESEEDILPLEEKEEVVETMVPDCTMDLKDSEDNIDHEFIMDDYDAEKLDSGTESLSIDSENMDISSAVKRIEEIENALDEDFEMENSMKSEKKSLFHFGKK